MVKFGLLMKENDFLELSSDCYIVDNRHQQNLELFHECSQGFIMSKGEGLPGPRLLNQRIRMDARCFG